MELSQNKLGEKYSRIWNTLNQKTLDILEEESNSFSIDFNHNHVRKYFQETSQYKIINLESMNDEEKSFIESGGLSLSYLQLNKKLITQDGVSEEKLSGRGKLGELLELALEQGYIYAICPTTGKIVRSNRSLLAPFSSGRVILYRFVGHEVFYLCCLEQLTKLYLYFPRTDLIVKFRPKYGHQRQFKPDEKDITGLKAFLVINWLKFKQYIANENHAKQAAFLNLLPRTPWHQVHNYFFPIHELIRLGYLQQFNKVYLLRAKECYSCFGSIDEIFTDNSIETIRTVELASEILENNLFVFNVTFEVECQYISDSLADRIYHAMQKKCSSSFLAEVQEANEKCFPLLWINFRTHKRSWLSKVEGIANIIKNLSKSFPNLGVVFDGFTRTDIKGQLLANPEEEKAIQEEKDILNQIQSLLPTEIKVYDIIGSPMHEVIIWAYAIDLYMVPVGSGLIKVRIPNKPGLVHSGTLYGQLKGHETMRENCITPVPVPEDKIVKKLQEGEKESDSSYDFDWKIAYEELLEIASSIKRDE